MSALDSPHVVLVKPPTQVARGNHLTLACPPLGIAYIAASLRERGTPVSVIDAVGEAPFQVNALSGKPHLLRYGLTDEQVVKRVPSGVSLIGISCMFSEEWPSTRQLIRRLGEAFPSAKLVVGGEHASAVPEQVLAECHRVSACVLGEGEETIGELVDRLPRGASIADVAGVAYRDGEQVRRTPRRARIRDVNSIPRPAWDLVPLSSYLDNHLGYGVDRGRSVPILASRGCPFQCTFCSSPSMWTTRWSARNPEAVLEEMESAIETHRAQNFDFYDLTAIVRKDWIVEFARKLSEKRWSITWQIPAGTRSEAIDAEVAELLYRSGCRNIAYAPESGSPALLKRIKKRVKLDRMKLSMREALHAGLKVKCNLVMGFPDETPGEMRETMALCRELARMGVHDVNVTPFCPYPGSELFGALVESGKMPALDDEYYEMLASYSDLTRSASFCEHVTGARLNTLRWSAMAQFYGLSFAMRPVRAVQMIKNLARGTQTTRLERALSDIAQRTARSWRLGARDTGTGPC